MNIFIHRRDLRHEDNTTLLKMNEKFDNINPIFIFNPIQIYPEKNKYFSNKDITKILHYMTRDKKNKSKMINLILLKKIGVASSNNEFSKNKIKLFFKKELFN